MEFYYRNPFPLFGKFQTSHFETMQRVQHFRDYSNTAFAHHIATHIAISWRLFANVSLKLLKVHYVRITFNLVSRARAFSICSDQGPTPGPTISRILDFVVLTERITASGDEMA